MTRQSEKDEACEFCYAPAVSVCIHCGTAVCKECSETRKTGVRFAMIASKARNRSSMLAAKASAFS